MNLFFLVEGTRTEAVFYPKWMSILLPKYNRVMEFDTVKSNNYYLLAAQGYPAILNDTLPSVISLVNRVQHYSHLVLCLDAEERTVEERRVEVAAILKRCRPKLRKCAIEIIVQNRCLETWLLGNRRVMTQAPQNAKFSGFKRFYDVSQSDPEQMGAFSGYDTHAEFHFDYLRLMLAEKGISYSKRFPRDTAEEYYLHALLNRIEESPEHLKSFGAFIEFCRRLGSKL